MPFLEDEMYPKEVGNSFFAFGKEFPAGSPLRGRYVDHEKVAKAKHEAKQHMLTHLESLEKLKGGPLDKREILYGKLASEPPAVEPEPPQNKTQAAEQPPQFDPRGTLYE